MWGSDRPQKTYVNIGGTDLVREEHGTFLALEDNARTPSGVSYVVENRHMMLRAFPDLLDEIGLAPTANSIAKPNATLSPTTPPRHADPPGSPHSSGTHHRALFPQDFLTWRLRPHL